MPFYLPVIQTLQFATRWLPPSCAVMEVGCGNGRLAWQLAQQDFDVLGIEPRFEPAYRHPQLQFLKAEWENVPDKKVQAVLFTRSLHHLSDVNEALLKAKKQLHENGILLLEEFDVNAPDEKTLNWFYHYLALLSEKNLLRHSFTLPENFAEHWHHDHEHGDFDLHTAREMQQAAIHHFTPIVTEKTAYLYRYAAAALKEGKESEAALHEMLNEELKKISRGEIEAVGWRMVAKKEKQPTTL